MLKNATMVSVLVVDDDEAIARLIGATLRSAGYAADWASTADDALQLVKRTPYDLLVVDYQLAGLTGLELATRIEQQQRRRVPVVVMTAHGHLDAAIAALRAGAADFLVKPFELGLLRAVIARVMAHHLTMLELEALRAGVQRGGTQHGLLGEHTSMAQVRYQVERMARTDGVVLITGESGTGKELVARALHAAGPRAKGPLVAINCGALPATLLESELFGHVKGAFTDARSDRPGVFREADGGTLFLDEVGELPMPLQAALLRVLQERKVRPVGANRELSVDVRVVAATNRDLKEAVEQRHFRRDLFFRLDVLRVSLTPLRERGDDVLLLARHCLLISSGRHGKHVSGWTAEVQRLLLAHPWPGNVRELENVIERAVLACEGQRLEAFHFSEGFGEARPRAPTGGWPLISLAALEAQHIEHVLGAVGGNKRRAAQMLGIDRVTLHRKLTRRRTRK
jgi:DNA-binding NtrC family response regulator